MKGFLGKAADALQNAKQTVKKGVEKFTDEIRTIDSIKDEKAKHLYFQVDNLNKYFQNMNVQITVLKSTLKLCSENACEISEIFASVFHEQDSEFYISAQKNKQNVQSIKLYIDNLVNNVIPCEIESFYSRLAQEGQKLIPYQRDLLNTCFKFEKENKAIDNSSLSSPENQERLATARLNFVAAQSELTRKYDELNTQRKNADQTALAAFDFYYNQLINNMSQIEMDATQPVLPYALFNDVLPEYRPTE